MFGIFVGPCRKVCIAANVESIQSAQKLKGCVIINGSLEIQIRGGSKYKLMILEKLLNFLIHQVLSITIFFIISLQFYF